VEQTTTNRLSHMGVPNIILRQQKGISFLQWSQHNAIKKYCSRKHSQPSTLAIILILWNTLHLGVCIKQLFGVYTVCS